MYGYYARLYLGDERLRWAGMAALVGPSFYAGFLDIDAVPGHVLGFFETLFLEMQRQIFEDQAIMHEAFLTDGLRGIDGLASAGMVDTITRGAWERIDSGAPALIDAGNRTLLYREQHDIIDRFYVSMRERGGGTAFTYALTVGGRPSIPGARPYPVVFPLSVAAPFPAGSTVSLATPLADGNIAVFTNRWALIERDTFPAYLRFLTDRTRARKLIGVPIGRRFRRFLVIARAGQLAIGLVSRWRLRMRWGPGAQRGQTGRSTEATTVPAEAPTVIDLARRLGLDPV